MNIPIFINVFNRITCLDLQLRRFDEMGLSNIIILDNNSTYPPLVDYLKTLKYKVIYLKRNLGPYALFISGILKNYQNMYFAYTDPDVIPIKECPKNILEYFQSSLEKYPQIKKVGIGLRIDNLPQNPKTEKIIEYEKSFWKNKAVDDFYLAATDTTLSLYRPNTNHKTNRAVRSDYPYIAEHLSWYDDPNIPSEELTYYKNSILKRRWSSWLKI